MYKTDFKNRKNKYLNIMFSDNILPESKISSQKKLKMNISHNSVPDICKERGDYLNGNKL
jgi:hypothetical protein